MSKGEDLKELELLSGEIRALDERRAELVNKRNGVIRRASSVGAKWSEIIDASGLSRGMIQRAIKGG